nr:Sensor protein KdpD [Candidatus Pantoea persica]
MPGGGLGLAICKTIVESHGGCIWAEIRIEGGVAFRLPLPPAPEISEEALK